MMYNNLSKIDIELSVDTPQNKLLGTIVDLENTSLVVKSAKVQPASDENCVASGEFYKYVSRSNGVDYVEKCTTQGEKPDFFVQSTPALVNNYVKVDTNNWVTIYDKNKIINFVEVSCVCRTIMEVVEAVNYNDWLQLAENGNGLEKLTTGVPVCRAKQTIGEAGKIIVAFVENYMTAQASTGEKDEEQEVNNSSNDDPSNDDQNEENNGDVNNGEG